MRNSGIGATDETNDTDANDGDANYIDARYARQLPSAVMSVACATA